MKKKVTKRGGGRRVTLRRTKARIENAIAEVESTTSAAPVEDDANHCDDCGAPNRTLYGIPEKGLVCVKCVPQEYHKRPMALIDCSHIGIFEINVARQQYPRPTAKPPRSAKRKADAQAVA